MDETEKVKTAISGYFNGLRAWQETVDPLSLTLYSVILVLIVLFRRPVAAFAVRLGQKFLSAQKIELDEASVAVLEAGARTILVSFALLLFLDAIDLPGPLGRSVVLLATSAIVVAFFATLYGLASPFILRLSARKVMQLEVRWAERVAKSALVILCIAAILKVWGLDISGVMTGVGVLGAGFMIAAQDLIRNLVAGMTNQSEERFVTGDAIEISGQFLGTVRDINLRSTTIEGFDNIPRFVPNAELSNATILNLSRRRHRRILMQVGLLLSTSEEQIEEVCDRLQTHLDTSKDFVVRDDVTRKVNVQAISEDAVEIQIYAFTVSPDYFDYLSVRQRLNLAILRILKAAGAQLAYPTRTIHVKHSATSMDDPAP
jgi:MscS family membrane protein